VVTWIAVLIENNDIVDLHAWQGKYADEHCKVFVENQENAARWIVYEIKPNQIKDITRYEMVD